jgi:glyoxylase-like metal-dependent hydrolase (beta-lactamase superfamily II)
MQPLSGHHNTPDHPVNALTPNAVLPDIFTLPVDPKTVGSAAYFIVENSGQNIIVDCPLWTEELEQFLTARGGVAAVFITHRDAIAPSLGQIQQRFHCSVVIQEQEAYLIPERSITPFQDDYRLSPDLLALWTPGYSPGSSCLYFAQYGGVLFTGRHLLPVAVDQIGPLRRPKTFHWFRQLASVAKLRDRFTPATLQYLCPGANTRYLDARGMVADPYPQLAALDLESLRGQVAIA